MLDIKTLKQNPLFAALKDSELKELVPKFTPRTVARGELVFAEGQVNENVYFIVDGKVKITRNSPDGLESIIMMQGPDDVIGFMSVLPPQKHPVNAIAIGRTELVSLPSEEFRKLLKNNNTFNEAFITLLIQHLNVGNEQLSNVVFCDVTGRVARVLENLTERFGTPAAEGMHVRHELTQEELAHFVGSSRETVNKALSDFSDEGWLRLGSRRVLVLDRDKLKERAAKG